MLTRFKVSGFKNLVDVDVRFGPFTCIAGANGVGKSNLFDAIKFLGLTAKGSLKDAALAVRGGETGQGAVRNLFVRVGGTYFDRISYECEIRTTGSDIDDFGREIESDKTEFTYRLSCDLKKSEIAPASDECLFDTSDPDTFDILGRFRSEVTNKWGQTLSPFKPLRTNLSVVFPGENSVYLCREELKSWRVLQIEPSSIRNPANESNDSPHVLGDDGAHLAATLHRIAENYRDEDGKEAPERIYAQAASRLHDLIGGDVQSIRVDDDDKRELYTLYLTDRNGTEHPARSLSDGTLRFLALITLWLDTEATGVFCIEEPENGIHPARLPALVRLLQDIAVNPEFPVGPDNPLRQVIVVTHSPEFVKLVPEDSLLLARTRAAVNEEGMRYSRAEFVPLAGTWRDTPGTPRTAVASINEMIAYLDPFRMSVYRSDTELAREEGEEVKDEYPVRVADRPDFRPLVEGK